VNINYSAPCNHLGYGVAGLNFLKALSNSNDISYFPIGEISASEEDVPVLQKCVDNQSCYDVHAPSVRLWHQHDLAQHIGKGMRVGFPVFELDTFTDREIHHMSSMDRLFVCSEWAKEVVSESCASLDIRVVPLAVNRSLFFETLPNTEGPTVFLNIGKWEVRKGHDVLIKGFCKAFSEQDNVELWMMNHNPFLSEAEHQEWVRMYTTSPLGSKVKFLDRVGSHKEVADIIRMCDCGVFPSRAEGWNLEALEMMACGKKVITTAYSAHTEFCNDENSMMIPIKRKTEAYDGIWFKGQGNWADIGLEEIDILAGYMRDVHKQKSSGMDIINKEGIQTSKDFSWENSANKFTGALK
tara:strand:- start:1119 stop:2180 length:1062 start_codon:yes stop_codon:yes gene_type:complete